MPDVVIVGGGPVGLVLALLLVNAGLEVEVWEQRVDPPTGTRAIGIHPPSLELFEQLGVRDAVVGHAVRIDRGEAWSGGRRLGIVDFADRPFRYPFVAALEQWRTERILRERLESAAPGALRVGTSCEALLPRPDAVTVTGRDASGPISLRAAVVAIASGGRTTFDDPEAMGRVHRYRDRYVMGDVDDRSGAGPVARVHLHRDGVVESFPLPDGKRRYVVHVGFDQDGVTLTADRLASLVTGRTGDRVDAASTSMLSAFGVRRRQRSRLAAGRIVHLGDAAHEISPIGGQGMNLGWSDARAFAPAIVHALTAGGPDAARLAAVSRRQLGAARRAGRQAGLNMLLGRPQTPVLGPVRDLALRAALHSPAMPLLADAYTMRWLR